MCEVETRDIYIPEDEIAPNTILELHIGFDKKNNKENEKYFEQLRDRLINLIVKEFGKDVTTIESEYLDLIEEEHITEVNFLANHKLH